MYERENRNILRRCLKTASDGVELGPIELVTCNGRSLCVGAGNWEGSPADSRQTNWQYCQTMGGEERNRCLDVMSARRVKHDCRYPGTVPLQIRGLSVGTKIVRSASAVTPSEKSSVNTIRKSTTHFPMSPR